MKRLPRTKIERLDHELEDLYMEGIDLPPRIQARWRRSDELRKMPRERDPSNLHYVKPNRARGNADTA
jgi:hypothetical protein